VDSDQLRLKIKSIRDVYRQEIAKINRSKNFKIKINIENIVYI